MTMKNSRRKYIEPKIQLVDLPDEVLDTIFIKLDLLSLHEVGCTCKLLRRRVESFRRANKTHIKSLRSDAANKQRKILSESKRSSWLRYFLLLAVIVVASITYNELNIESESEINHEQRDIKINLEHLEKINELYPGLLSSKKMRIIKTRIAVMLNEVSILMLLGKSKDSHCKYDPTFCIGRTIANVTQLQYSYIDASDPYLKSVEIQQELWKSLDGSGITVMIDSLEKLPGSEVMNLFQFIDKDSTIKRRGMLLFVVYTGADLENDYSQLKEADIAERILVKRWSEAIPKDSLTSVLSRMCGSIVKVF